MFVCRFSIEICIKYTDVAVGDLYVKKNHAVITALTPQMHNAPDTYTLCGPMC